MNQHSDTDSTENGDSEEFCAASSDDDIREDKKSCSVAIVTTRTKSPYELLRDKNIARNKVELSAIMSSHGFSETAAELKHIKTMLANKEKTRGGKRGKSRKDLFGHNSHDLSDQHGSDQTNDLHYRDLTDSELSAIMVSIKENVGRKFSEYNNNYAAVL